MKAARLWLHWPADPPDDPEPRGNLMAFSTQPLLESAPAGAVRYVVELELPTAPGEHPKVLGIRRWLSPDDDNYFTVPPRGFGARP